MKSFRIHFIFIFFLALGLASCGNEGSSEATSTEQEAKEGKEYTSAYVCPMHCEGSGSDEPGKCPVCNMDYVANEDLQEGTHDHGDHDHSH